ncbi:hypothetical protein GCM10027046_07960 [Uliginosibacterium flavum]
MGLGTATTSSRIGGPLRIEIPMQAGDADRIELSCIRVVGAPSGYSDDTPWLSSNARLTFESGPRGALLVVTARPTSHPAIMLGLRVECGMGLRRDYTLLLNPPNADESSLPATSTISTVAAKESINSLVPTPGQNWKVQAGDSARTIAERVVPGDRQAQRQFALSILRQNATRLSGNTASRSPLPAGIELELPPLPAPALAALPERSISPVLRSEPVIASPAPQRRKAETPIARDRLFISGGSEGSLRMSTTIGQHKELNDDQRTRLRTEMQLIASLDEKIATQIELKERLRQLEAMQAQLKQEATRLESELQADLAQQSAPQETSNPLTIQASPPLESLAQQAAASAPRQEASSEPLSPWYASNAFILGGLLSIAAGLSALLWLGRRRRSKQLMDSEQPQSANHVDGEDVAEHLIDPISEADIWPDEEGHAPKTTPRSMNAMEGALGHFTASGLGPVSLLQIVDDDAEEHDSAIELAEIMMSFGRVHGAAQTLADFIRSNPKQAVKPWIKLLEVYRAADMRVEFDALTTQLNKTFNVKSVGWDAFDAARQAPESLESMPHILARLDELWGKRECQIYLHGLLRDNRQGSRQGFPLAIVDEILMLLGVLESQIGAYRPDPLAETVTPPATHTHVSTALNVAPIATEFPTQPDLQATVQMPQQPRQPAPLASAAPAFSNTTSLHQLDFELDMTNLSKTLHLNLDDISEDGSFIKDTDSI